MHNPTNILTPARAPTRLSGAMAVRTLALTYLTVVLIIPLAVIFYDGLRGGLVGMVRAILQPVAPRPVLEQGCPLLRDMAEIHPRRDRIVRADGDDLDRLVGLRRDCDHRGDGQRHAGSQ